VTETSPATISAPGAFVLRTWLWRVLFAVTLCVAAALAAGTLLAFAAEDHWRLELLSHFRAQYCWGLFLTTAIFAALRRWFFAAASLAAAIVNFALIVPLYVGLALPAGDPPRSRIMSLNVYFHNKDYERVLEAVARENPDVLLLLELTPDWARAVDGLRSDYPFAKVAARGDSSGMGLYSRLPIDTLQVYSLAESGLPTMVAELLAPSGRFALICIHTVSPIAPSNFRYRNRQLDDVAKLAADRAGPVMLIGDLNTTSWSPYFARLVEVSGLRDSRRGFGVEGTWPWLPLPLRIPIDHCLVSPTIAVYGRHVGDFVGSDHRPIVVDFAIEK
jgi:endonuclease/exonuclease/phosphatase (EEP) superfamily protein YafD